VPLVGYQFFRALNALAEVTLVTHGRNQEALERASIPPRQIIYLHESRLSHIYYRISTAWLPGGMSNWPLYHVLTFPIYAEFNTQVDRRFHDAVAQGEYDIVHVLTPMMPRYPVKLIGACHKTPFLLGPVNGGIPFPKGFQAIAAREFSYLNFFRTLGRWVVPGYAQTYCHADRILAGSTYTQNWIQAMFGLAGDRIVLFAENGLEERFFASQPRTLSARPLKLLFVGRLVPYKAADIAIEAISRLTPSQQQQVSLTLVGDGSQRSALEQQVAALGLKDRIQFVGWVAQDRTRHYYQQADVFCFPSVREFGGAVVLEAMAASLPCIVTDYGGIGEYVTPEMGFKIEPRSREFLIEGITQSIQAFLDRPEQYASMSQAALARAEKFRWIQKAAQLVAQYQTLIEQKQRSLPS
jgi:glycosyltransferase involved in cell wall biosynthesis